MKRSASLLRVAILFGMFTGSTSAVILWEAFNDHRGGASTSPNATTWEMRGAGSGGPLKDISTGIDLEATFAVEEEGAVTDDFGANSAVDAGSPADLLFAGKCTIGGVGNDGIPGIRNSTATVLRIRFSDLDPTMRYTFRGTTCRGNNYVDRWAVFKIVEAESAVAAHVDGSPDLNLFTATTFPAAGLLPEEVALNTGDNKAGSLIGWDEISPGADGTFAIEARQYVGVAPFGNPSAGPYGYGLNAIYLAEVQAGPGSIISAVAHNPTDDTTELTWTTNEGELFEVRKSLDLGGDPATWPVVMAQVPAAGAPATTTTRVVDTNATDPTAFYKVFKIPRPPVFEDDFETDKGWIAGVSDANNLTQWERGSPSNVGPLTGADGSATCFGTNIAADYGPGADIFLRSPPIELTGAGPAGFRLSFQHFKDNEPGFDFGSVRVLRAADDVPLGADVAAMIDGISIDWERFSATLPPEATGETVRLEFQFQSDPIANYAGWYIDDVVVRPQ